VHESTASSIALVYNQIPQHTDSRRIKDWRTVYISMKNNLSEEEEEEDDVH
jgi:hypothetical protein